MIQVGNKVCHISQRINDKLGVMEVIEIRKLSIPYAVCNSSVHVKFSFPVSELILHNEKISKLTNS
jgi:hypothetical protein